VPTIGVKDEPEIADQVLLEHGNMMPPRGDPARTRRGAWETKPARRELELPDRRPRILAAAPQPQNNLVGQPAACQGSGCSSCYGHACLWFP